MSMMTRYLILALTLVGCAAEQPEDSQESGVFVPASEPSVEIFETLKISPMSGANIGAGGFHVWNTQQLSGNWTPQGTGDILAVPLQMEAGQRFLAVEASVYGNTGITVTMGLYAQDDAFHVGWNLGQTTSSATNLSQTLTLTSPGQGAPETAPTTMRSYWLQFRAQRLSSAEGRLFVGPIRVIVARLGATTN